MRWVGDLAEYATSLIDYVYYLAPEGSAKYKLYLTDDLTTYVAVAGFRRRETLLKEDRPILLGRVYSVIKMDLDKLLESPRWNTVIARIFNKLPPEGGGTYIRGIIRRFPQRFLHLFVTYMEKAFKRRGRARLARIDTMSKGVLSFIGEYEGGLPRIVGTEWRKIHPLGGFIHGTQSFADRVSVLCGVPRNKVLAVFETTKNLVAASAEEALELGMRQLSMDIPYLFSVNIRPLKRKFWMDETDKRKFVADIVMADTLLQDLKEATAYGVLRPIVDEPDVKLLGDTLGGEWHDDERDRAAPSSRKAIRKFVDRIRAKGIVD